METVMTTPVVVTDMKRNLPLGFTTKWMALTATEVQVVSTNRKPSRCEAHLSTYPTAFVVQQKIFRRGSH